MAQQYVLSLAPYPKPAEFPKQLLANVRFRVVIATWDRFLPTNPADGSGDLEDFTEQAYRLQALVETVGVANVWLCIGAGKPGRNLISGEELALSELYARGARDYGVVFSREFRDTTWQNVERMTGGYATFAAFQRHAGRPIIICGVNLELGKGIDVIDAILELHTRGVRDIVLKTQRTKHGFWFITLPETLGREQLHDLLLEELDWSYVHLEGLPRGLILQPAIRMRYEYRIFIVDGEPTTGAGAIEEYTPAYNREQFDAAVRDTRLERFGGPSPVEDRPELVARYVAFAKNVAQELRQEIPALTEYVIDVALGVDGEPLVVELNGLSNAGLYASEPRHTVAALAARA
jgi:hypothetical protein